MAKNCRFLLFICALKILAHDLNAEHRCVDGEVPCDAETCISPEKWCNKVKDCTNEIDENYCQTARYSLFGFFGDPNPNKCKEDFHKCGNGVCFPASVRCDGYMHCEDESDEEDCIFIVDNDTTTTTTKAPELSGTTTEEGQKESLNLTASDPTKTKVTETVALFATNAPENNASQRSNFSVSSTQSTLDYYGRRMQAESKVTTKPSIRTSELPTHATRHRHGIRNGNRHSPVFHNRSGSTADVSLPQMPAASSFSAGNRDFNSAIRKRYTVDLNPNQHYNRNPQKSAIPPQNANRNDERGNHNREHTNVSPPTRTINSRSYHERSRDNHRATAKEVFSNGRERPRPFYFHNNNHETYAWPFAQNVHRAREWLLRQRDRFDGWKKNTPRAVIALSLINNTFLDNNENNLIKKQLEIYLGIKIMRNTSEVLSLQMTASFINALLATCHDPRDVNGVDIVEDLRLRTAGRNGHQFVNPVVYLSLCLSGIAPTRDDLLKLERMLNPAFPTEETAKDMQVLALSALACYQKLPELESSFRSGLRDKVRSAAHIIRSRRLADGSFGNVYNTALVLQALFATDETTDWQPELSLQYLSNQQLDDGSFGDLYATYLAIPALSGTSLVHLRNTKCNIPPADLDISRRNSPIPTKRENRNEFSLYFENPVESSFSVTRFVPTESSLFDIMRLIDMDGRLRFKYENDGGEVYVTSLYGIPNDAERGKYWHLYVKKPASEDKYVLKRNELVTGDIARYYPKESDHIIFWNH